MSAETIARLHIVLDDIKPAIWRRVDVPVTASLKMLHDIVQAAMGWEDCHLWHFEARDRRYGIPDPMWPQSGMTAARKVKFATLIDWGVRELVYTSDIGDDWRHNHQRRGGRPRGTRRQIPTLHRRGTALSARGCLRLARVRDVPRCHGRPQHEEHDRLREWYGGPYDADDIDERFTRRAVAAIAIRRHAGKLAYQKSRTQ